MPLFLTSLFPEGGKFSCEYPMIAFNMEKAEAVDATGRHVFTDYEELREWWNEEDKTDHS